MTTPNIAELIGPELDYWVAKAEGFTLVRGRHSEWSITGLVWVWADDDDDRLIYHPTEQDDDYGQVIYSPSTNWAQGGPIIERERIAIWRGFRFASEVERGWLAVMPGQWWYDAHSGYMDLNADDCVFGPTPLIAAMRAYVSSKQPTGEPPC